MNMIHCNPNHFFGPSFDQFFSDFGPILNSESNARVKQGYSPRVDILEEKDVLLLTAEIPGVDRDSVKVEVDNNTLTLSGEKKTASESEDNGYYLSERSYGLFKRSFKLPDDIDREKIKATYNNGVLKLVLQKKPEAQPRSITIENEEKGVKKVDVS